MLMLLIAVIFWQAAPAVGTAAPLDANAIFAISAAVTGLTQMSKKAGMPDGPRAIIAVAIFSAFGVALWVWSLPGSFDRTHTFSYFSSWITVATASAGIFSIGKQATDAVKPQ